MDPNTSAGKLSQDAFATTSDHTSSLVPLFVRLWGSRSCSSDITPAAATLLTFISLGLVLFALNRWWMCPVPRRLFNRRLALTHHRNRARHVFYDLVNEQRCCETCVCVLGGEWVGGGLVSDRDLSAHPHPSKPIPLSGWWSTPQRAMLDRQESLSRFPEILPYPLHKSLEELGVLNDGCKSFTAPATSRSL